MVTSVGKGAMKTTLRLMGPTMGSPPGNVNLSARVSAEALLHRPARMPRFEPAAPVGAAV